jgi:hypothetical protein
LEAIDLITRPWESNLGFGAEGIALLKQAVQQMTKSGRSIAITQALNHLAGAQAMASASFSTLMICSSLNRVRFMPAFLSGRH